MSTNIQALLDLANATRNETLHQAGVPVADITAAVQAAEAERIAQVTKEAAEALGWLNGQADSQVVRASDLISDALKQIDAQRVVIDKLVQAKKYATSTGDAGPLTVLVAPHLATTLPESRKKVPEGWSATPAAAA